MQVAPSSPTTTPSLNPKRRQSVLNGIATIHGNTVFAPNTQFAGDNDGVHESPAMIKRQSIIADESWREVEIDGFKSLIKSSSPSGRVFWAVILVACAGILIYEVSAVFINYYTRPLSTSYSIFTNRSMIFPSVNICPLNGINWTTVDQDKNLLRYAWYLKEISGIKNYDGHLNNIGGKTIAFNYTLQDVHEKFMRFGYQSREFMPACSFSHSMKDYVQCSDIVEERLDARYGKCFALSLGPEQTQNVPGEGLRMVFHIHKELFPTLSVFAPKIAGVELRVAGAQVLLRPGSSYKIDIHAEHLVLVNLVRGSISNLCREDDAVKYSYHIFRDDDTMYNQGACMTDCYNRQLWSICRCLPLINPSKVKSEILNAQPPPLVCDTPKYRDCVRPKIDSDPKVIQTIEHCQSECHPPCDYMRYQLKVSDAPLTAEGHRDLLNLYNTTIDNIISVDMAYPSLDYVEFKQDVSKSFDELVSDLGGQVGLWLGASMVTLIQIPFVLTTLCVCESYRKANVIKKRVAAQKERRRTIV